MAVKGEVVPVLMASAPGGRGAFSFIFSQILLPEAPGF